MKRLLLVAFLAVVGSAVAQTAVESQGNTLVTKSSWNAYKAVVASATTSNDYVKAAKLAPYPAGQAWGWYNAARLIVWTSDFRIIQGLTFDQKKTAAVYLAKSESVMTETGYINVKLLRYIQEVKDTINGKK